MRPALLAAILFAFCASTLLIWPSVQADVDFSASPSEKLLAKHKQLERELIEVGTVFLFGEPGDEFCFLGVGLAPNIGSYGAMRSHQGYELDSMSGPLFLGSDTHWHLVHLDHSRKTKKVYAFAANLFGAAPDAATCSRQLLLRTNDRLLEVRTSTER